MNIEKFPNSNTENNNNADSKWSILEEIDIPTSTLREIGRTALDSFSQEQKRPLEKHEIQERVEQDLNRRLLTINNLEKEISANNPAVEKSTRNYEGTEIPVYTLKGIPFSMLSHDIEYRRSLAESAQLDIVGTSTSRELVKNPSIWAESEDVASRQEGYGTTGGNARGNVISTSYVNSESNLDSRVSQTKGHPDLCYGFSQISSGELLDIHWGDGTTSNTIDKNTDTLLEERHLNIFDKFEGAGDRFFYNEVVLHRYSKDGEPYKPDYIIAENDGITDDMLKHAAYFNIPIVNIDKASYVNKMKSKAETALDSINENSPYTDINTAIDQIKSTSRFENDMKVATRIGDGTSEQLFKINRNDDETLKKIKNLGLLEMTKRIDFIADELQKATDACLKATEEGKDYHFSSDAIEEIDDCKLYDYSSNKELTDRGEQRRYGLNYGCNSIDFNFRMKGSTRFIKTEIIDGEHRETDNDSEEIVKNRNSSYYNKVAPVVMQYLTALRQNKSRA